MAKLTKFRRLIKASNDNVIKISCALLAVPISAAIAFVALDFHPPTVLQGLAAVALATVFLIATLWTVSQAIDHFAHDLLDEKADELQALLEEHHSSARSSIDAHASSFEEGSQRLLGEIQAIVNSAQYVFSVYSLSEIMHIEENCPHGSITIITRKIKAEAEMLNLVRGNILRGVSYTYLVPNDATSIGNAKRFLSSAIGLLGEDLEDKISIWIIDDDRMRLLASADIIIYGSNIKSPPPDVYWFMGYSDKSHSNSLYYRVEQERATGFVEEVEALVRAADRLSLE